MGNESRSKFDLIDEATKIEGPHGWIQWKGTDACMDVRCACGTQMHVDGEFAYHLECSQCDRVYVVGSYVKLVELTDPNHIAHARENCCLRMEAQSE